MPEMNKGKASAGKAGLKSIKPGTIKRLFSYMAEYKVRLVLVVIFIIISALASVLSSLFIEKLIDNYITPMLSETSPDFGPLAGALGGMAVIYACGAICALLYNRTMAVIGQGTLKKIRDEMFSHMQGLPVRYFDTHPFGDVMSHYTNDADSLRQMITQSIPQSINAIFSIVMVFVSMLYLSVWLSLFVVAFMILFMKLVRVVAGRSGRYFMEQQKNIGILNGYIEEMMNGQKVVKVFNHEEKNTEGFCTRNEDLRVSMTRANIFANIMGPINNNMGYVMYVLIAVIGGAMGIAGVTNISIAGVNTLTLGMIASFLVLSRSFMGPIGMVSQQINSIVMALAGAARIFELLDETPETDEGDVTLVNVRYDGEGNMEECEEKTNKWAWKTISPEGNAEYVPLKGDVKLENVDFGYNSGKQILFDVNVFAEPGQKVAFVGATGAGKTTITNLINRFYDISDGSIEYDGIDIKRIRKNDLRHSIGIVLQDVNLFTGTVMDNIRYGKLDATDEECIAAAKLANADGFIRMLPEGYNTVLTGNGSGLSQGQRQLISIARAAVADPPVMILDEATSSIDTRTEALVQRGMDALMNGRTVFVIAHRLSTVRDSDVIMVMDHGRIIERGSHDRLIEKKGTYYQLYMGAFELD
ncbi:MAG: ABC transporter ATP-binding protein/permease [Lachnospiraceae bacterium]|nr:ABC transporter ATP-binding protein/permease [Lachnospiraceae bacterium]